jgi:hypothetical protein
MDTTRSNMLRGLRSTSSSTCGHPSPSQPQPALLLSNRPFQPRPNRAHSSTAGGAHTPRRRLWDRLLIVAGHRRLSASECCARKLPWSSQATLHLCGPAGLSISILEPQARPESIAIPRFSTGGFAASGDAFVSTTASIAIAPAEHPSSHRSSFPPRPPAYLL